MKIITSPLFKEAFPLRPDSPEHREENDYAEWWRNDIKKRRELGIGEEDLARKAKQSRLRAKVRGPSPFSPGKKSRMPTTKDPKSISEFWTSKGKMPDVNLQNSKEVDARDIAYEAYNNTIIGADDAMSYKEWLMPLMPENIRDESWRIVVDAFLNKEISKEDVMDWRELMGVEEPTKVELPPKKIFEDDEEIFDWKTDEFLSKGQWNQRYPHDLVAKVITTDGFLKLAKKLVV